MACESQYGRNRTNSGPVASRSANCDSAHVQQRTPEREFQNHPDQATGMTWWQPSALPTEFRTR